MYRNKKINIQCRQNVGGNYLWMTGVPDGIMWAQPAPSTQWHNIRSYVYFSVKVNCDCGEFKECNEEENVCICIVSNSILAPCSHDVYLSDL
jgi:hypothetical protein